MKEKFKRIGIKAIIAGLCFFIGYFGNFMLITRPITDVEFEYCEQVAQSIYAQKDEYLIEVPNNVGFVKTDTEIKVWKGTGSGKVIATLENGKLVFERNKEIPKMLTVNILIGVLFVCVFGLIDAGIDEYKEKKAKSREV